jgi:hypothetical protein
VPSRSIDISSSSSSSSGSSSSGSSPKASGAVPDSLLGDAAAAASIPPADSTRAVGSDLPQSVRPPPVGPQGEESEWGVLGSGSVGSGAAGTAGMGMAGSGMMPAAAEEVGSGAGGYDYNRIGVTEQDSSMQQLLQEGAEAPVYVPEAAAARTAAPEAPLEPLGSPMFPTGDERMTPQPTPMSAFPSDNRETFEAASIAAIASEAADDAMQQQKEYEQQQEQQPLLEEQADSSFHSPTSSAYQTPASALSLASSTGRGSEIFATPAGSLAAGGLSARSSTDGTGSSPARPAPPAAAAGSLSSGPMSLGTEGVGDAANTRLVTAPLDNTEGRVSTADAGSAS